MANWQDEFAEDGDNAAPKKGRSESLVGHLKRVVLFGSLVLPKDAGCHDLCDIFAKMAEAQLLGSGHTQRAEYMTAAQCRLLRLRAHEMGYPSVALEQALAFGLGVRQKDVIGEWIPLAYPGVSDVVTGTSKWIMGFRWEEVDANLVLTHRLSKSMRGKNAVMDTETGKLKAWDLRVEPMIVDELRWLAGKDDFDRSDLPASGPMILCESTGRPWVTSYFQRRWRKIAIAAGIPDNIQNRDSRPGAATEADLAGAPIDKTQRGLGHSKKRTTEIYLRDDLEVNRELTRLRTEKRKP